MTRYGGKLAWEGTLKPPLGGRTRKPRDQGITFLSVKGWGPSRLRGLAEVAADYIDRVKLSFGTTLLYREEVLREMVAILREADIQVNPGGTCGEIALHQGKYDAFLARCRELGFTTIEVSDGTLPMDEKTRERCIRAALDAGFDAVSEAGKKDPREQPGVERLIERARRDLSYGVSKVTVESRHSARGIGVYDEAGRVKGDEADRLASAIDPRQLIWETPTKEGQEFFIRRFGVNVNLGNVAPDDIIPCEGLRQGLRGDSFRWAVRGELPG